MKTIVFCLLLILLALGWVGFHSIPTEGTLRRYLAEATKLNIVEVSNSAVKRSVLLEAPSEWADLPLLIDFHATFWQFSDQPGEAIVLEAMGPSGRSVFDVRPDNCIHIRKAVRWYRMPVDSKLRTKLEAILDEAEKRKTH